MFEIAICDFKKQCYTPMFTNTMREDQQRKAQEQLEAVLVEHLESGKSAPLSKADWTDVRRALKSRLAARTGKQVT